MNEYPNVVQDAGSMVGLSSRTLSDSVLRAYRAAVGELALEAGASPRGSEPAAVAELLAPRLAEPEIRAVFSRLDAGADAAAARLLGELRSYRPTAHSSASDLATFVRILLLSQIDSVWWAGTAPFATDADVLGSAELAHLSALRSARALEFQYRPQPAGLAGRARDWARHKAAPTLRPRLAGLRFTCSRPAVVAVVNRIARDFAAAVPPRTPRIWVTSLVRSVEHQHHLRSLGYAAVLPSAHCVGYACDIESSWFRRFDPGNVLAAQLAERQAAGQLNVIDEGKTWHLCVNPDAREELNDLYQSQLGAH